MVLSIRSYVYSFSVKLPGTLFKFVTISCGRVAYCLVAILAILAARSYLSASSNQVTRITYSFLNKSNGGFLWEQDQLQNHTAAGSITVSVYQKSPKYHYSAKEPEEHYFAADQSLGAGSVLSICESVGREAGNRASRQPNRVAIDRRCSRGLSERTLIYEPSVR
ncbi:hypothetical protein BC939DRAFT_129139 [Gamsiella multidivaricata]|uniref:uncharacterized protein n=1 Tax=Gamsiella multidivaricata TaxID=101098 RepID=UPI00221EF16A|nr:uncharacterized protein BC939DRAFT_129139 [Gamsiella multidivaricata]KAI7825372.1 hypothetical protein BC939DRAFT_129139 [Gamsiella multidivaricata]